MYHILHTLFVVHNFVLSPWKFAFNYTFQSWCMCNLFLCENPNLVISFSSICLQIADAVVVARYLGATIVLPDIRGSKPGDKRLVVHSPSHLIWYHKSLLLFTISHEKRRVHNTMKLQPSTSNGLLEDTIRFDLIFPTVIPNAAASLFYFFFALVSFLRTRGWGTTL